MKYFQRQVQDEEREPISSTLQPGHPESKWKEIQLGEKER